MDFLSGLLMMVAGWFGFDATQVETAITEPTVMMDEVIQLAEQELHEAKRDLAPSVGQINEMVVGDEVDSSFPTSSESDAAAMTGEVAPVETVGEPAIMTMLVAGGCFWCVEADLEKTPGVIEAVSGYAGGTTENPKYDNYGSGGHREVVEVTYDANQISFEDILIVTLKTTDPTDDDGTFKDRGDKYSSAFYYETTEQKQLINSLIDEVDEFGPYDKPLAIDVEARPQFWPAEDFHQNYYKGFLSKAKYQFYRNASGRTDFIKEHWGEDTSPNLPWRNESTNTTSMNNTNYPWTNYVKPDLETLRNSMDPAAFRVTQEDGTERAGTNPLDKVYDRGIYVDVLSGEPLFSSRDKFDSGTGWPSFVAPITPDAVTEHEDRKLFVTRTEIRSAIADNHLGHVFSDGPSDRGGLRYCMNGVALRFVPEAEMEVEGYGDFVQYL